MSKLFNKINLKRLRKYNIKNYNFDISKKKKIEKLKKYDLVIDCCAEAAVEASKKDAERVFYTNLVGTFNILEKIKKDKSNVIFLSTSRVYSIEEISSRAGKINTKKYRILKLMKTFQLKTPISRIRFH